MNEVLVDLFRHMTWATLEVIELCQRVDAAVLETRAPGAYGSIRETLLHLVRSEEGYYWTVTRSRPSPELREGASVSLNELAERIGRLGPLWQRLAADPAAGAEEVCTSDGFRVRASVPMAQAIHHADAHRTQVLSILGASGLGVPDLDVWDYVELMGELTPIAAPAPS